MKTKIVNANKLIETVDKLVRGGKEIKIRHSTSGTGKDKCGIVGLYTITYEED